LGPRIEATDHTHAHVGGMVSCPAAFHLLHQYAHTDAQLIWIGLWFW